MKNFTIALPPVLHSVNGTQKKVSFEMSRRHYEINGTQYNNHLSKEFNDSSFEGYMCTIQNKSILVTLFYVDDVLRSI